MLLLWPELCQTMPSPVEVAKRELVKVLRELAAKHEEVIVEPGLQVMVGVG